MASQKKSRILHTFELSSSIEKDGTLVKSIVEVELSYNIGGINYFSYTEERRGLYLSVSPYQVKQRSDSLAYATRTYVGFSGLKTCVKELKCFSAKQLETFKPPKEVLDELINQIRSRNDVSEDLLSITLLDSSLYA